MSAESVPPLPIRQKPLPPASAAAVLDALRYPFSGAAVAAILVITLIRLLGYILPLVGVVIEFVAWAAIFKYALEVLSASGQGKSSAPEVVSHVDAGVHSRHVWAQLLVLLSIVVALVLFPGAVHAVVLVAALILPGLVLSLTVAQNLLAAFNPLNWGIVAARLGLGYLLLSAAWWGLLYYQLKAFDVVEPLPRLLGLTIFYLINHYLLIALFRWKGLFLAAHAKDLGFDQGETTRPVLQRDREQGAVAREIREAQQIEDPRARADKLAEAVRRGASAEVNQGYRAALRACNDREALRQHAQVHACELIELGQDRAALNLVQEALNDDPNFHLPDARQLERLLGLLERLAQWRSAAALALNYRQSYSKRIDGLTMAERAAGILIERLQEPEQARKLLNDALAQAAGYPIESAIRQRLSELGRG